MNGVPGTGGRDALTVFLVACNNGDPNHNDCVAALNRQQPPVNVVPIYNEAPMDRAFQAMLDRCETPFFIQVDQDMVLQPCACAHLLATIQNQPDDVAFVVYMLRDVHLDMPIQGVKIYRHAIVKQFPYVGGLSCEKSQLDRIREAGYKIVEYRHVLGEHSPKWTNELIFERYFDLMEKWKRFSYSWLEDLPRTLLEKYVSSRNELDHYAFLGAWASASRPEVLRTREKDFRLRTPEYLWTRHWFSQPTQATLYLTDRCNLYCSHCLRQGNMAQVAAAPDLDASVADEVLSRFPSINSICFCGFGETLLHPKLWEVLDHCKAAGRWVGIITNGVLLKEAWPMLLDHRPHSISISLNAHNASEHYWECGVDWAWQRIMEGLNLIREHYASLKALRSTDTGIPIFLSRICTAINLDGIPAFLQLAKDLEIISGIDLHNVLPHDVGTPENEKDFLDTVLTTNHREAIAALQDLPGAELVRSWPVPIDTHRPVRRCEYPFRSISVDGNKLYGICNSIMPPQPENGTIRDARVWHSKYAADFRMQFAGEELPAWCKWCFRNFV